VDFNVVQADVGPFRNLLILGISSRCCELNFSGVFKDERALFGHVEEKGGAFEWASLELGLDVSVDEGGDAGKLHLNDYARQSIKADLLVAVQWDYNFITKFL